VSTDLSGQVTLVSLPPDLDTILVKHPGFRDQARSIQLSLSQRVESDFTMELSGVQEQVTVRAAAPLLETGSAELVLLCKKRTIGSRIVFVMENRNGLATDVEVLQANGTAERDALVMIERIPGDQSVTVWNSD
jgi:hypothetical protein